MLILQADEVLQRYYIAGLALSLLNFVVAIITYIAIFVQLHRYSVGPDNTGQLSFGEIFRKSKYYTAVLLVATYLLLNVVPSVLWTLFAESWTTNSPRTFIILFTHVLSDTADVFIYIFNHEPALKKLLSFFSSPRTHNDAVGGGNNSLEMNNIENCMRGDVGQGVAVIHCPDARL